MKPVTEWMVRVAAVVVIGWFGWNLVAGSVVQMMNLNLQNRALQKGLLECQQKGTSTPPSQSPGRQ